MAGEQPAERHIRTVGEDRPGVLLVCDRWDGGEDDAGTASRLLLGCLAVRCGIEIASLEEGEPGGENEVGYDGIFRTHRLRAGLPRPDSPFLRAALGGGPPAGYPRRFAHLPSSLLQLAEDQAPASIICAGRESLPLAPVLRAAGSSARIVGLPLGGRPSRGVAAAFDELGALSKAELETLAGSGSRERLLRPPLSVDERVSPPDLGGLEGRIPRLLVLSGTEQSRPTIPIDHDYWRAMAGRGIVIVEVLPDRWIVTGEQHHHEVPFPPTRMDLWRLMNGALATVDLRPGGAFGREAIESLLYGTPVVVPAGTAASSHALESGGGLAFKAAPDALLGISRLLRDDTSRQEMSRSGRQWALAHYGTGESGCRSLEAFVLG